MDWVMEEWFVSSQKTIKKTADLWISVTQA